MNEKRPILITYVGDLNFLSAFLLYRKQLAEAAVDNILAKRYIEKIR
ncbi:hypothetical protein [Clostridium sp. FP1]|nr:hypothetical protein [Clostridium sp. FP1]MBZ9633611.1 hypothetical protein [Clostridium sp. FP1]